MRKGDHNSGWEGRKAGKHEVRRAEELGKEHRGVSSIAAKMQMHCLCLGGDGS